MRTMFYGSNSQTFRYAKKLRQKMTPAEESLWYHLSKKQINGYRFKRQHPIRNYIADFYCHKAKLIREVDGRIHEQEKQRSRDLEKNMALEELGCRVLRFSNDEVTYNIEQVLAIIRIELNKKTNRPNPKQRTI